MVWPDMSEKMRMCLAGSMSVTGSVPINNTGENYTAASTKRKITKFISLEKSVLSFLIRNLKTHLNYAQKPKI